MTHADCMKIAAQAWEQTKPADDPSFEQCALDHQFRLAYKVESVKKTGRLEDEFDQAVKAILDAPPTEVLVEPPVEPPVDPAAQKPEKTAKPPKAGKEEK